MQIKAALNAITENINIFAAEQLSRLDHSRAKALRLPGKVAYFQGGSAYHRVAVVCPLEGELDHEQQLVAGLIWANKVSNGQKTVLYLVGTKFSSVVSHLIQFFGHQIEVRLAYYSPRLSTPFLIAGREAKALPPRYLTSLPRDQGYWERTFNPVEKGWFVAALDYFRSLREKGMAIWFLDNWVSIRFRGLEIVRISKKESRLRIALITRCPREVAGSVGTREEKEGWINAQGLLNGEFIRAFEQRLTQLTGDKELFARVCQEKYHLEYLIRSKLNEWGLDDKVFCQLDVGYKGETELLVDMLCRNEYGNLVIISAHPQKDLFGFVHCLEQLVWSKLQFAEIKRIYFDNQFLAEPETWLVCPKNRIHPDIEILRSLLLPERKIKLLSINDDWSESGITCGKWIG